MNFCFLFVILFSASLIVMSQAPHQLMKDFGKLGVLYFLGLAVFSYPGLVEMMHSPEFAPVILLWWPIFWTLPFVGILSRILEVPSNTAEQANTVLYTRYLMRRIPFAVGKPFLTRCSRVIRTLEENLALGGADHVLHPHHHEIVRLFQEIHALSTYFPNKKEELEGHITKLEKIVKA